MNFHEKYNRKNTDCPVCLIIGCIISVCLFVALFLLDQSCNKNSQHTAGKQSEICQENEGL